MCAVLLPTGSPDMPGERRNASGLPVAPLTAFRRAFWTWYLDRIDDRHMHKRGNESSRWLLVPRAELAVSLYLSRDAVGLFVRGPYGTRTPAVADRLEPCRETLERRLGVPRGDRSFPFHKNRRCDVRREGEWPAMAAWLRSEGARYAAILAQEVGGS